MNFYRTYYYRPGVHFGFQGLNYHPVLKDAHVEAKKFDKDDWAFVFIELVDIPTDKTGVLALLRGIEHGNVKPRRSWELTTRGGLNEVPVEEAP
jgi:hypothetical protein